MSMAVITCTAYERKKQRAQVEERERIGEKKSDEEKH